MRTLTFRDHALREWPYAPRRGPVIMTLVGVACVLFDHLLLPRFPERVLDFMRRGFLLDDLVGVMVLNDLMAVYFPTFFVGLAGSLGVVLLAREEHRLELLLAKPVRARDFLAARTLPILASTTAVGVTISGAGAIATAAHAGASVSAAGALGCGLALTALAVVLIAALQLPFTRIRDPFTGMLVACGLWLATSMPSAVLLYRPDAYAGRDALRDAVVMPSLLWHEATLAWLGPLLLVVALLISALLARAAGVLLERSDAM